MQKQSQSGIETQLFQPSSNRVRRHSFHGP
jgi:hypothetical protein